MVVVQGLWVMSAGLFVSHLRNIKKMLERNGRTLPRDFWLLLWHRRRVRDICQMSSSPDHSKLQTTPRWKKIPWANNARSVRLMSEAEEKVWQEDPAQGGYEPRWYVTRPCREESRPQCPLPQSPSPPTATTIFLWIIYPHSLCH